MSLETDIYDFQGVLEQAMAAPFLAAQYVCSLLSDGEKFQKTRPRLELSVMIQGAMESPLLPAVGTQGVLGENRALIYGAQTKITVVSGLDITTHRAYLAKARNFTATFKTRFNGETILNHALMAFKPTGEAPSYKGEDGYYITEMLFDSPFSIQIDKLEELVAAEA